MKKVALYSSSNRSRKQAPEVAAPVDPAAASADAPAVPVKAGKAKQFLSPLRAADPRRRGRLFAVALLVTYAKTRPAAYELTQKDIDAGGPAHAREQQPAVDGDQGRAAIAPSVVRVMGFSPEKAATTTKRRPTRARPTRRASGRQGQERGKDKDAAKDKGKTAASKDKSVAAKDKLSRNDGGKPGRRRQEHRQDGQGQGSPPRIRAKSPARTRTRTRPPKARAAFRATAAPAWARASSSSTRV
jgi:hypothetical protein